MLGPFAYVMPALSKTGENAAFYSDTYRPDGTTHTKLGSLTLGTRDGAPFCQCHGLWTEADGKAGGGHMLPDETVVADAFEVEAFGIDGAMFTAEPDPETNSKLFGPVPAGTTVGDDEDLGHRSGGQDRRRQYHTAECRAGYHRKRHPSCTCRGSYAAVMMPTRNVSN